jgi:hypothetical protein
MDSVMSKTPPTAKKAVGSGALVVTIAIIPRARRLRRQLLCWIVSLSGSVRHAVINSCCCLVGAAPALFCGY